MSKRFPFVYLRVIAFFCVAHRNIRRPEEDVFAIAKWAFSFLKCFESVHYECTCFTLEVFFTLPENCVLKCKNCNALSLFWLHLGAVYSSTLEL